MGYGMWMVFALILLAQNFSFTFTSRARNSASLKRHVVAALMSNGVWFLAQGFVFKQFYALLTGEKGVLYLLFSGAFYTIFTVVGSIAAHVWALRTEKGKGAVGASRKYAQITIEERDEILAFVRGGAGSWQGR